MKVGQGSALPVTGRQVLGIRMMTVVNRTVSDTRKLLRELILHVLTTDTKMGPHEDMDVLTHLHNIHTSNHVVCLKHTQCGMSIVISQ